MLRGRNVILGVTGSIAAYKSVFLCRLLIKHGANVKVVMTPDAKHFVGPLTFSTLSKNPVYSEYYDQNSGEWSNHVELAKWADFLLIAPATANTIAKMANGNCDNLLLAVYLSADCPVFVAPTMDLDMFKHPSFKTNIQKLESYGNRILPSGEGELASGFFGEGRMCEPEEIIEILLSENTALSGKKVLVSAGPTYEKIDPVRFIGNHSSGKMGIALAQEAYNRGADVTLVLGPVSIDPPKGIAVFPVTSAEEMYREMTKYSQDADVIIMAAAISDYRPKNVAASKMKKNSADIHIELEENKDILQELGSRKTGKQFLVGFALETDEEEKNARKKLEKKNLDMIVLNSLKDEGAGFGHDTNKVKVISKSNNVMDLELKPKTEWEAQWRGITFEVVQTICKRFWPDVAFKNWVDCLSLLAKHRCFANESVMAWIAAGAENPEALNFDLLQIKPGPSRDQKSGSSSLGNEPLSERKGQAAANSSKGFAQMVISTPTQPQVGISTPDASTSRNRRSVAADDDGKQRLSFADEDKDTPEPVHGDRGDQRGHDGEIGKLARLLLCGVPK